MSIKVVNLAKKKGGIHTEQFAKDLMDALECHTVFTIPIGKGIPVYESVVVTWIIMAVFTILSIILVRNLRVENVSKKQLILESGIAFLQNFFESAVGKNGVRYVPYLITVALYIGASNLIGILGFTPPTKDMVTVQPSS